MLGAWYKYETRFMATRRPRASAPEKTGDVHRLLIARCRRPDALIPKTLGT